MGNSNFVRPTPLRPPPRVPSLLVGGYEIPLREGEMLIGRGAECEVSILGTHVSRVHAKLANASGQVTIHDPGSRNGVFLNGTRITEPTVLTEGDAILIGTTELIFYYGAVDSVPPDARVVMDERGVVVKEAAQAPQAAQAPRRNARTALLVDSDPGLELGGPELELGDRPTLHGAPPRSSAVVPARVPDLPEAPSLEVPGRMASEPYRRIQDSTRPSLTEPYVADRPGPPHAQTRDALDQVIDVVERMMVRGDVDAAHRTFSSHLAKRVDAVFAGQELTAPTLQRGAVLCLDLLERTRDASWFDQLVKIYTVAAAPMSADVVERVAAFLALAPAPSRSVFAGYQSLIRTLLGEVSIEELEACERVLAVRVEE